MPVGGRKYSSVVWTWNSIKPPPEEEIREKAKKKPQTQSVGTNQAYINLSSFKDVRSENQHGSMKKKKKVGTRKHNINLKIKKDPLGPRCNLEFFFFWTMRIKEKRSSRIQAEEEEKEAIYKEPKSWGAQIFHMEAWIQNVFFLLK